jgi:hypothetical protein
MLGDSRLRARFTARRIWYWRWLGYGDRLTRRVESISVEDEPRNAKRGDHRADNRKRSTDIEFHSAIIVLATNAVNSVSFNDSARKCELAQKIAVA